MSDTNALKTRIASELNRALTDDFGNSGETVATVINREINAAIKHYTATRFRFNERKGNEFATTAAGTREYSLPADFLAMDTLKLIYNGNYITIDKETFSEIDAKDTKVDGSSRGVPSKYTIYGNVVRLFPVPNGAYTLVGSYMRRFLPTSLTGSYTAQIPFSSYSLTVTSTASHNNRLNGWTTDAEELIRCRAKASVKIKYLKNPDAIAEMRMMVAQRELYLSAEERMAFERMADETVDSTSTGLLAPYYI